MKHFVVESTYRVPIEQMREVFPRHRAYLQTWYDQGLFLFSGPKNPPVGGFLIARAESVEVLEAIFAQDPFTTEGFATFTFTEFQPAKRQNWMEPWFTGTAAPAGPA